MAKSKKKKEDLEVMDVVMEDIAIDDIDGGIADMADIEGEDENITGEALKELKKDLIDKLLKIAKDKTGSAKNTLSYAEFEDVVGQYEIDKDVIDDIFESLYKKDIVMSAEGDPEDEILDTEDDLDLDIDDGVILTKTG